jgi:ADP-ribose pyrophosphatase YjhB (NUDIX family)
MDLAHEHCPNCGHTWQRRNPLLTVDIIIEMESIPGSIVLVRRRNEPLGWALPGGFVDYGETVEAAAAREALEETGLKVRDLWQLHTYSDPSRDPRGHMVSVVFTARAGGTPRGGDDAREAGVFSPDSLPEDIVFDHRAIIDDYLSKISPP